MLQREVSAGLSNTRVIVDNQEIRMEVQLDEMEEGSGGIKCFKKIRTY